MEHERYAELMSAVLDGEASAAERRELEDHLARCPGCAALFRELSEQSAALRSPDCGAPKGLKDRVMAALPEQERAAPKMGWRRWGALAACAVLVVAAGAAGIFAGGRQPGPMDYRPISNSALPRIGLPEESGQPLTVGEQPDHYPVGQEQVLRVCWGHTPAAPSARIIGSLDSLADFLGQFPMDDLSAVADAYGPEFFETNQLLAAVVTAGSGSIGFSLAGLTDSQVEICQEIPEIGTCDMAAWLILAEVTPMFRDGDTLDVVFVD